MIGPSGSEIPRIERRIFLSRFAALSGLSALAGIGYVVDDLASGSAGGSRIPSQGDLARQGSPAPEHAILPSGVEVPTASWVVDENSRTGTLDWVVTGDQSKRGIEGFASAVSAAEGHEITLFVNTKAASFHVEAYRMGFYQGLGARLIWRSDEVPGIVQPPPVVAPDVHTVSCPWAPSMTVNIDEKWPPGSYLLKLVGSGGEQQFITLCLRDDDSHAAFVVQHSVTTWQAYNLWGGYSLYYGSIDGAMTFSQSPRAFVGKDFAHRSRIVSFDRPYSHDWGQGSSDLMGNEFPLIYDMERLGLDVTYRTDVDLHRDPENLLQHRCLLSLGHDEYWSLEMRNGALAARDSGVNLAFLGANACYRPIRLEDSPVGSDRLEVCYKSAQEDPISGVDGALATPATWSSPPTSWDESWLVGSMYQGVGANADMVVTDPSSWLWSGTGLTKGEHLPKVVFGEYDRLDPALPHPANVEVLAHSRVPNRGPGHYSDVTWYTVPHGGGGVLATGTASWVHKLANSSAIPIGIVPAPVPGVTARLLRAMENVYSVLGSGPASLTQPSLGAGGLHAAGGRSRTDVHIS